MKSAGKAKETFLLQEPQETKLTGKAKKTLRKCKKNAPRKAKETLPWKGNKNLPGNPKKTFWMGKGKKTL